MNNQEINVEKHAILLENSNQPRQGISSFRIVSTKKFVKRNANCFAKRDMNFAAHCVFEIIIEPFRREIIFKKTKKTKTII